MTVATKLYPFKHAPFGHQLEWWQKSKDEVEFAYFMEMGTGKSKLIIDVIAYLYDSGKIDGAFILGNKGSYRNWYENEIPTHMPDHVRYWMTYWDSLPTSELKRSYALLEKPMVKLKIFIMNIEALAFARSYEAAEEFCLRHNTIMIIDESTTIKNPDAKRTKAAIRLGRMCKYRRIATGEPATNRPLDVFSQCMFLNAKLLGHKSFYTFRARYAQMVKVTAGQRAFNKITGYQNIDELQRKLSEFSCRVLKQDCIDLPDKIYQTYEVEMTDEQKKLYRQLKNDAFAMLSAESIVSTPLVITKLLRLHQLVCGHITDDDGNVTQVKNNRMSALMDVLDEVSGKAIIFATYRADVELIKKQLIEEYGPDAVVTYYGATSNEDRQTAVKRFQTDSTCRFFIGNKTAAYGITLTAANTVIYYSNDYNLEVRLQGEDRAHRIGQKSNVTYVDLVCRGTVDEKIVRTLKAKKSLAAMLMGDEWRDWIK